MQCHTAVEPRATNVSMADLPERQAIASISFGPFRLFPAGRLLEMDGRPFALGHRALDLLIVLAERAGEVVTQRELMVRVWRGLVVSSGNLRVQMNALRKVFKDFGGARRYITNVKGQGYCFVAPIYRHERSPCFRAGEPAPAFFPLAGANSMPFRLDPYAVSPKEMQELISFQEFRDGSSVQKSLIELLRTRVSQLNGCAHGIRRHMHGARILGETHERLSRLADWHAAPLYSELERAALAWTEAVTRAAGSPVSDAVFARAREWFTDVEIVNLTMIIAATNAWNRVELSFSSTRSNPADSSLD
jgi:AhpD family alkylhydroperoxidase